MLLQSLFIMLATATDRQLARYVEFLRAENRILRERLGRQVRLTPRERHRLVRLGRPLGRAINRLITIVSPGTFRRWLNRKPPAPRHRGVGRPRKPAALRSLVQRLARETGWGVTRIHGELKKLGVRTVSRTTVRNILREAGIDSAPQRSPGAWTDFLKRHAATLWACDFFSVKVWTLRGRIDVFVFFFIHLGTRRVEIAGLSAKPEPAWMIAGAESAARVIGSNKTPARFLIRDRDSKFDSAFDAIWQSNGVEVIKLPPRSPNLNAVAERWVRSVREECLSHFVLFGEAHLRHLIDEYVAFYNGDRPHQALGNQTIQSHSPAPVDERDALKGLRCTSRLGGLLRHYYRKSA